MDASQRGADPRLRDVRGELCDRLAQSAGVGQGQRGAVFGQNEGFFGHGRSVDTGPRYL